MNVNDQSAVVQKMARMWPLIDALLGGTQTIREGGELWLPRRKAETDDDYKRRVNLTTLFPAFTETVGAMTGRVFSEPVQFREEAEEKKKDGRGAVPKWIIDEVIPDADRQGRNMHVFMREWFFTALGYGLSHVLIESPRASDAVITVAKQRESKLRPYLIHVSPKRVLGWRVNKDDGQLDQLRLAFEDEVADGDFGTKLVEQVRVYDRINSVVSVTTHEKIRDTWVRVGEPVTLTGVKVIPFVTMYTNRTGFMTARPPLLELAYLNLKHYVLQSGVDSLTDIVSVPILTITGDDDKNDIQVGAKSAIHLEKGAEMKWVEHTGASIKTGMDALAELKKEMESAGARLLVKSASTKTATEASEDTARANSKLGAMVQDAEDSGDAVLDFIAAWRNEATGGKCTINANLEPDFLPIESMNFLNTMANDGRLSSRTVFKEAQRRSLISEDESWEEEQVRIKEETPPPPTMPTLPGGNEGDEGDEGDDPNNPGQVPPKPKAKPAFPGQGDE